MSIGTISIEKHKAKHCLYQADIANKSWTRNGEHVLRYGNVLKTNKKASVLEDKKQCLFVINCVSSNYTAI